MEDPTAQEHSSGAFELSSDAFGDGGLIPAQYTCDGEGTNPPLAIGSVPAGTRSLALIVDDPDVPKRLRASGVYDHWVLFNIPPLTTHIPVGGGIGITGANSAGKNDYAPPCPPSQYEPHEHRYIFTLYALDRELTLPPGASKDDVLRAADGHVLDFARLTGRYQRM